MFFALITNTCQEQYKENAFVCAPEEQNLLDAMASMRCDILNRLGLPDGTDQDLLPEGVLPDGIGTDAPDLLETTINVEAWCGTSREAMAFFKEAFGHLGKSADWEEEIPADALTLIRQIAKNIDNEDAVVSLTILLDEKVFAGDFKRDNIVW